ncbi:hypothetical protein GHT06_017757 [Daphnia sinensis]|uniref:Uncharacterized protein n=1 Tax=Daphnia sinensis TaxID=1820382 RepID=A0AAD5PQB7_9CRUS|nr:hypothetical protein GHT06_017757 [Daphnia sinensis]
MKDPSLEQKLILSTIDDRDEGVDVCDLSADKVIVATVSPNSRRHQLIPGRQSVTRWIGRNHPVTSDICETIPEETSGGFQLENEETRSHRHNAVITLPLPRRHHKLLPLQHLSLNLRQVRQ